VSRHGADDGSFARDAGTQTGRAVVLIVVAVLVAVLLLNHSGKTTANASSTATTAHSTATTVPSATTTTVPATTTTTVPLSSVKVQVLNGASPTRAIAGPFTVKLRTMGYDTVAADNATSDVTTSSIYVLVTGFAPEAATLATSLGLPASAVVTTVPASAPIPASTKTLAPDLVLVVGPDLASKA
jgi:hypothetical protein